MGRSAKELPALHFPPRDETVRHGLLTDRLTHSLSKEILSYGPLPMSPWYLTKISLPSPWRPYSATL